MQVFLASIPLEGRKVVVVGGGEAGLAKARLVARTPAELLWFAPDETPPAVEWPARAIPLPHWPEPFDLDGAVLVFLAVFGAPETEGLAHAARARGALVNVVDRPELCDFHTPALIERGEVVIGVATGGASPVLARDLRARIETALPAGLEILSGIARRERARIKAEIADPLERRRFWERALRGEAARRAALGDAAGAQAAFERALSAPEPPQGAVWIVRAPAEPDLLTLRALKVLQDADLIVYDPRTPDPVLDCARRDARRLSAQGEDAVAPLVEAYKNRLRAVRLTPADASRETLALTEAGVAPRMIP